MPNLLPLGLPKGSVRALIALIVVGGSLGFYLTHGDLPQSLLGILGVIIGYYFGSRAANGQGG